MSNNSKMRKAMVLVSVVCMFSIGAAGCGSGDAPAAGAAAENVEGIFSEEAPDMQAAGGMGEKTENGMKENAGNSEGKWQVPDPETVAAEDADFEGVVWKIEENSFFIVKSEVEILEDGSMVSSTPAPGVEIPDEDLIPVVFDEDTHFYMRTIYENGARYEDGEAGYSDLETGISVDLKGRFENDIFHADEIRILKVS